MQTEETTPMKFQLYGYSDDVAGIDGDIQDEFDAFDRPICIGFSSQDVFRYEYDVEGVWRITHVKDSGQLGVTIEKLDSATSDLDTEYSDVVYVTAPEGTTCLGEVNHGD